MVLDHLVADDFQLLHHPDLLQRVNTSGKFGHLITELVDRDAPAAVDVQNLEELDNIIRVEQVADLLPDVIGALAEFIEGDGAVVVNVHSMEYLAEFWHHLLYFLRLMDFGELFVLISLVKALFDDHRSDEVQKAYTDQEYVNKKNNLV